jgi:hypothetical protein
VAGWRDEIIEAAKTKAERDAEEAAKHKKRVEEALTTADASVALAKEALGFARDRLRDKGLEVAIDEQPDRLRLALRDFSLTVELARDTAVLKVTFGEGKPREFDFAKDRHIAPPDVEEYVGRRLVELVRAAQKAAPW